MRLKFCSLLAFFSFSFLQTDHQTSKPRCSTYGRVSAHPLRRFTLLRFLHTLPEPQGLMRIIAGLRHHHQANVVRLALLHAAHGSREQEVQHRAPNELRAQDRQPTCKEYEGVEHDVGSDLPRHALGYVSGEVVRDLVTQDCREAVLVPSYGQQAAEDEYLAAGEDESVRRA